jgi:hypothetical protein
VFDDRILADNAFCGACGQWLSSVTALINVSIDGLSAVSPPSDPGRDQQPA